MGKMSSMLNGFGSGFVSGSGSGSGFGSGSGSGSDSDSDSDSDCVSKHCSSPVTNSANSCSVQLTSSIQYGHASPSLQRQHTSIAFTGNSTFSPLAMYPDLQRSVLTLVQPCSFIKIWSLLTAHF